MITLDRDIVQVKEGEATASIQARIILARHDRLVIDIYRLDGSRHPEDHLGWWLFHFHRRLKGDLLIDVRTIGRETIRLKTEQGIETAADCWFNDTYRFAPVQDLHLVVRDQQNRLVQMETYQLVNASSRVLKDFYDTLHATDGYKTTGNTFLETLHHHKLGLLRDIFLSVIPAGGKVLDVGCGNSLFTEISPQWNFNLVCCDLGEPVIRERTKLFPQYRWLVADVASVPFRDEHFDALFAGEIIEHVTSVHETMAEWFRLLKPGGVLVMTTPNRLRLRNRINHSRRPLGADHLNEMTLDEAVSNLERVGFVVDETRGFYLELFLNWFSRRAKVDYLQSRGNKPANIRWMNLLNRAGHLIPAAAFGLIFVARKR